MIRGQDLVLTPSPQGGKSAKFLLGMKAYDHNGNALNWEGDVELLDIKADQYVSIRRNGVPAQLNIDLPAAEEIHLVTAVYDLNSGAAGTLEVPLSPAIPAAGSDSSPSDVKHP
jgi:hypothetical protein